MRFVLQVIRSLRLCSLVVVAAGALAMVASSDQAHSQNRKKSIENEPGYKQAVCFCRATNKDSSSWAQCMASRGFKVAPGSGSNVSC